MSHSTAIFHDKPLAGRVAIVTGAASDIVLAMTELLHSHGACVVAAGRGDSVNALAREGIVPLVADVAQESQRHVGRPNRARTLSARWSWPTA